MLPPDGRGVAQQVVGRGLDRRTQVRHRVGHVGRVPIYDGGDDEVEPRSAILLRLARAVGDASLFVGADGTGQNVALLGLVQSRMAASAQRGRLEPVEHEQRTADAAHLGEREVELVLPFVGGKLLQHRGGRDDAGLQRGYEADDVPPVLANEFDAHPLSHDGLQRRVSCGGLDRGEPAVGEVAQAGAKAETQQRAQGVDVVGAAASIGVPT